MQKFTGNIPARQWVPIRIPLTEFRTASIYEFRPREIQNITFQQTSVDAVPRTVILDEIRIDNDAPKDVKPLLAPRDLRAVGYDRHVDLTWQPITNPNLARYTIYRSLNGGDFEPIGTQLPTVTRYTDFLGKSGIIAQYKVGASDANYSPSPLSDPVSASTRQLTDDEMLTMLQEDCFRYYWEAADPSSGMALESVPGDDRMVATGASGFGIMALLVGVERGLSRANKAWSGLPKLSAFSNAPHATTAHGRTIWTATLRRPCPSSACSTTAAIWSRPRSSFRACSPRGSTFMAPAKESNPSTAASRRSRKASSGIGTAKLPTAATSIGTGRHNGAGKSTTLSSASTR